jgi:hypothetical protein
MKKNVIFSLFAGMAALVSLAFMVGKSYSSKSDISRSSYAISKETAHRYVEAWRQREEAVGKKRGEYVEAFDMHATELQDILQAVATISNGNLSTMNVRFYMGVNDAGKPTLVVVGVNAKGENVAYYKDAAGNLQSAIFDFTTPRPPFGPDDSL